jgi:hypothetical protein
MAGWILFFAPKALGAPLLLGSSRATALVWLGIVAWAVAVPMAVGSRSGRSRTLAIALSAVGLTLFAGMVVFALLMASS